MLVRFDCGCIGLDCVNQNKQHLIIKACDMRREESENRLTLFRRNMSCREFKPLSIEASEFYEKELAALISDGYVLCDIKRLLK